MGWTTYYYCCPICGRMEMASTQPALKDRITRHVLGHSLDVLGLTEKQRERLSLKIDLALKKIEEDFCKGLI